VLDLTTVIRVIPDGNDFALRQGETPRSATASMPSLDAAPELMRADVLLTLEPPRDAGVLVGIEVAATARYEQHSDESAGIDFGGASGFGERSRKLGAGADP
jgi:hypothetical protein